MLHSQRAGVTILQAPWGTSTFAGTNKRRRTKHGAQNTPRYAGGAVGIEGECTHVLSALPIGTQGGSYRESPSVLVPIPMYPC